MRFRSFAAAVLFGTTAGAFVASQALASAVVLNYFEGRDASAQVQTLNNGATCSDAEIRDVSIASGNPALNKICFLGGGLGSAYARAVAGPGAFQLTVTRLRGANVDAGRPSRGGFEVMAVGDTAVQDSFQMQINVVNTTTANAVFNGELMIQRNALGAGKAGIGRLEAIVYPDSFTAKLDPARTGAGALFIGRLVVDRDGIEKAEGGWTPANFTTQVTTDRVLVRAVNLTKSISCPNSAALATYFISDASSLAVPSHTPLMIGILALLTAAVGWMAIRRRATA